MLRVMTNQGPDPPISENGIRNLNEEDIRFLGGEECAVKEG